MHDPVLNLYFAQARMYDPTTRRFMAVDPIRGNIFNPQLMIAYTWGSHMRISTPAKYTDSP